MKSKRSFKRNNNIKKINITLILSTIFIISMFCIYSLAESTKLDDITYSPYTIISGDTLWDISSKYKNPKDDPRDFIQRIVEINQLSSLNVIPGQELLIPTYIN